MQVRSTGFVRTSLRGALDVVLEASVVGSFSRIGYLVRRGLFDFADADGATAPVQVGARRAVVTGASSGIGFATAQALSDRGFGLVLVSRDPRRNVDATRRLAAITTAPVTGLVADIGDLTDVRDLAAALVADGGRVDVLVHCAGVLNRSFHRTEQGFEETFAVHVLGPHLLTGLLADHLGDARAGRGGRVVTVSSGGMYAARLDLDRLESVSPATYRPKRAYAAAKRVQVEFAIEWAARLRAGGSTACTMHPGWVDTAAISAGLPGFSRAVAPLLRRPEEGADTVVWLATAAPFEEIGGRFYLDRRSRALHPVPRTRTDARARRVAFERVSELVGLAPHFGEPRATAAS